MSKKIEDNIKEAVKLINERNNFFIASHVNPDGDNIGSMLALALALRKLNKNVNVLKSDYVPKDFKFLPGYDSIKEYNENLGEVEVFIAVDSSDEERLGPNKELLYKADTIINIDHHVSNTMFGNINIVDSEAAATGELIYQFIKKLNVEIDKEIGDNLYTAISTDTGKFSYESVTSNTHKIISELIDTGIDFHNINVEIYENMSIKEVKLFLKVLSTLNIYEDNKIATAQITQNMLKETNTTMEDSEGIVAFLRKISTVEVACLLKEIDKNDIKISLRSKNYVDVSKICESFNGGGHKRAAGCSIEDSIDKAERIIVEEITGFIR